MRILIIRLSSIGDVAEATAVAAALKDSVPSARIDWLISPPAAELLAASPDIDEVLLWDRRPFDDAVSRGRFLRALSHLFEARALLSGRDYDVVLDVHDLFLTGLLSRFASAKRRVGIADHHEGSWLFLPERVESDSTQKLYRYLDALRALGVKEPRRARPRLAVPPAAREAAHALLEAHGVDPRRPYLVVSVQSTWGTKEWPAAYYAEALAPVSSALPVVFVGTTADAGKIDEIMAGMDALAAASFDDDSNMRREDGASASLPVDRGEASMPCASLAGRMTLLELAAVLEGARLYFGPDTGPLHIASAVGTPTLSLWGATHPSVYAPLGAGDRYIVSPHACRGCGKTRCRAYGGASPPPCMTAITPAMARDMLLKLL